LYPAVNKQKAVFDYIILYYIILYYIILYYIILYYYFVVALVSIFLLCISKNIFVIFVCAWDKKLNRIEFSDILIYVTFR